VEKSEVMSWY